MEYINRKLFKIASYILFKQIIAFNKKWKGIADNMHSKYARDINGQTYIMDYTLEKIKPTNY